MRLTQAFRLLTVIPMPGPHEEEPARIARSSAFFPLVGLVIGAVLYGLRAAGGLIWSPLTVNVVVAAAWIFLTGGLHLDGLSDTADGLWGGWTREKRLSIMKDSRIGAFGAIALLFMVLLKIVFLSELAPASAGRVLFLAPALGRWVMVLVIFSFPPARPDGLGALYRRHFRWTDGVIALAITLAGGVLLLSFWGPVLFAVVTLLVLLPAAAMSRALGGLTGDTYGALCEIGELTALMAAGVMSTCGAELASAFESFL